MPERSKKLDWHALMDEALTAPGNLTGVYDRFHSYSLTNMLFFLSQGVHEPVASWKRWKSLGRHVLKGAHAKEVIVPILVKGQPEAETDHPQETEDEKRERIARLIGFKVVRGVFSYSDTDGPELPEIQVPEWSVETALDKLHIKRVPFEDINGNVQGYAVNRDIAINPVAVNPTKTLFHEMGHVVLGHTVASSQGEYALHRGLMEFGAEATAYLSMNELELMDADTASHSRAYIQEWLQSEVQRPGEREIRFVFAATDTILKAGRVAVGSIVEDAP